VIVLKVKYVGCMNNCNVNVFGNTYFNWAKDEVRDLPDKYADKLIVDNKDFILESDVVVVKKSKIKSDKVEEK